jgi:parallel beta-helix repeat protein
MVQSSPTNQLFVNPATGRDDNSGNGGAPLRTITAALRLAQAGTTIQLAPGNYGGGEQFPIVIPAGVVLQGDPARQGSGVVMTGSGEHTSATFALQNVTIVAVGTAQIRGVTVTNPASRGTGIWVESASPTIANCTFTRCQREGIFVTGKARPLVSQCSFSRNAANGISIVREAKGEYRQNTFQDTGLGLTIGDNAAPLLIDNQILENVSGIVLSRSARPVLRGNTIAGNREVGIAIGDMALPDLGSRQDPGRNILRDNAGADVRNSTSPPLQLLSVGNQLKLSQVLGPVELVADELPPPAPVIETPPPSPVPTPSPVIMPPPPPPPVVTPPPAPPAAAPQFSGPADIRGHWAEAFIQALVTRGIISGFPDGSFRPEAPLTRVQYAAMIAKTYDLPLVRIAINFTDVPADFWGFGAIVRASEMGFLSGFPDKTFRPGANLTRIQAILGLVNGLQLRGGQPTTLQIYGDRAQIPAYAIEAVATGTQRGMIVNHPNPRLLNPLRDITRGEVSALLYQSLVSINRATPIASEFIVTPQLSTLSFTDLESHWSKDFILPLAAQDLIRGYGDGSFQPDTAINRVQFAAIVARAFNPPAQRAAMTFSDLPDNFWGKGVIDQAYRGGFLDRFPDASIRPASGMSRLELVQALVQGLGLPGDNAQRLKVLSDRASIPANAQGQVSAAIGAGILVNYPDKALFNPNQPATRADMTTMVYQAMARSSRVAPVSSAYIVK